MTRAAGAGQAGFDPLGLQVEDAGFCFAQACADSRGFTIVVDFAYGATVSVLPGIFGLLNNVAWTAFGPAPVDQIDADSWQMFSDLILSKSFPAGIRRVRQHRALGHRTVLITGALDFVVKPLAPLFDDIVCARLGERALELQPDFLPALWPLGLALSHEGRHDEAITAFHPRFTAHRFTAHCLAPPGRALHPRSSVRRWKRSAPGTWPGVTQPVSPVIAQRWCVSLPMAPM